jgi:hypothetical protein
MTRRFARLTSAPDGGSMTVLGGAAVTGVEDGV